MENQVLITVSENGWDIKIQLNGEIITETHRLTPYGSEGKTVIENHPDIPENLKDALEDISPYETAKTLSNMAYEQWDDR